MEVFFMLIVRDSINRCMSNASTSWTTQMQLPPFDLSPQFFSLDLPPPVSSHFWNCMRSASLNSNILSFSLRWIVMIFNFPKTTRNIQYLHVALLSSGTNTVHEEISQFSQKLLTKSAKIYDPSWNMEDFHFFFLIARFISYQLILLNQPQTLTC